MIDLKDLVRPPVLVALAGSAAAGFVAGFLVGRDPQLLRRLMTAAAQGWEQARLSVAEAREDLADQWAAARETARHDIEEDLFAAADAAAAAPPAEASAGAMGDDTLPPDSGAAAKVSGGGRRATTRRRGATRPTH